MSQRILIVEDEKNIGETLSEYLQDQGHDTSLCQTVGSAIDKMNSKTFDIRRQLYLRNIQVLQMVHGYSVGFHLT